MRICAEDDCLAPAPEGHLYCRTHERAHPEDVDSIERLKVVRVLASSVPLGESVCRYGRHVWVVLDWNGKRLGTYATSKEAKRANHIWPKKTKREQRAETYERYHRGDPRGPK
jgi:hypothetical protein